MATIPTYEIGDAANAADVQQRYRSHRGYGHITGGPATAGSGLTVSVPIDTEMYINGATVAVDTNNNSATLDVHDRWPRWATIVVNSSGAVKAHMGEVNRPLEVEGEELTGRRAPRPAPPIVTADDEVLHSLVWVPPAITSITDEDIIDRRLDARVDAYGLDGGGGGGGDVAFNYDDWNWVHMVDAGADPDGVDDVSSLIETHAADDTVLLFTSGDFRISNRALLENYSNLAIIGRGDVTFIADNQNESLIRYTGGTGFHVKNVTFDYTADGMAGRALYCEADDKILYEDVTVVGTFDSGSSNGPFRVEVSTDEGVAEMIRVKAADGSDGDPDAGGFYTGPNHYGTVVLRNCHFEGWEDNGIYNSGPESGDPGGVGTCIVEGGTYKNNDIAQVRFQGTGCAVRDAFIGYTDATEEAADRPDNARGVRLRAGDSHVVENCRFEYIDDIVGNAVEVHDEFFGEVTVRDCVFDCHHNNSLRVKPFTGNSEKASGPSTKPVSFINCSFYYGDGTDYQTEFLQAAREYVFFRDCRFENIENGNRIALTLDRPNTNAKDCYFLGVNNTFALEVDDGADESEIRNCRFEDSDGMVVRGATSPTLEGNFGIVLINATCTDAEITRTQYMDITDDGTRTLINGWGENAGDPSSTGSWNGQGRQGVNVWDTTNSVKYTYLNGAWR